MSVSKISVDKTSACTFEVSKDDKSVGYLAIRDQNKKICYPVNVKCFTHYQNCYFLPVLNSFDQKDIKRFLAILDWKNAGNEGESPITDTLNIGEAIESTRELSKIKNVSCVFRDNRLCLSGNETSITAGVPKFDSVPKGELIIQNGVKKSVLPLICGSITLGKAAELIEIFDSFEQSTREYLLKDLENILSRKGCSRLSFHELYEQVALDESGF